MKRVEIATYLYRKTYQPYLGRRLIVDHETKHLTSAKVVSAVYSYPALSLFVPLNVVVLLLVGFVYFHVCCAELSRRNAVAATIPASINAYNT